MSAIITAVRTRPISEPEIQKGFKNIVVSNPVESTVTLNGNFENLNPHKTKTITRVFLSGKSYNYDYVFGPEGTQKMVYENMVKPLISNLFSGINVAVMAYGHTGTGKTHTMGTSVPTRTEKNGVMLRAIDEIFHQANSMEFSSVTMEFSSFELYVNTVYDLLSTSREVRKVVPGTKKISVENLTKKNIKNSVDGIFWLKKALRHRAVNKTDMNSQSSRSHAFFTITINVVAENKSTTADFVLVDLAGSERDKYANPTPEQRKESIAINKSLSSLRKLFNPPVKNMTFWRESLLSTLLRDYIGGNSLTVIIACISPGLYFTFDFVV